MKKLLIIISLALMIISVLFFMIGVNPTFHDFYQETNISTLQGTKINVIFNETYGGEYVDVAQSITKSETEGYVISGWTNSTGHGNLDIWVLKIGDDGDHIWNRTFGGIEEDKGFQIINYSLGGYAIAATYTNTSVLHDNNDFSVLRIADDGNVIWHKNYSGPDQTASSFKSDLGRSIVECPNGDLALAGVTGTDIGASDVWFFRLGPNGIKKWERTYDHWDNERCYTPHSLVLCDDGGFAVAGYTYNVSLSNDVWLIRTDPFGIPLWNKTYGVVTGYERPESIIQCEDGGFGIMANTQSFGAGGTDGWFIRTDASGNQIWNKTFGGSEEDSCTQVIMMPDGGFTLIGSTHSFDIGNGDAWIIRLDSYGNTMWNHTIGDPYGNAFSSILYLGNDTFVATGTTRTIGSVHSDVWILKFQIILNGTENQNPSIPGYEPSLISGGSLIAIICLIFNLKKSIKNGNKLKK